MLYIYYLFSYNYFSIVINIIGLCIFKYSLYILIVFFGLNILGDLDFYLYFENVRIL